MATFENQNEEASLALTLIKSSAEKKLKESILKPSKLHMLESSVQNVEQAEEAIMIARSDKINTTLSL